MVKKPEVLAIIPARGGSKSIPRKNIKPFAGHPLLSYSIAAGIQAKLVDRVIVSTDDEQIASVAKQSATPLSSVQEDRRSLVCQNWCGIPSSSSAGKWHILLVLDRDS